MGFGAVSEAFARARRLEGAARAEYLDGLEDALRKEVEELLGHHAAVGPTFEPGWTSIATFAPAADEPPELSGFRILRRIGSGGMGVVFEAEQLQPRRRVAIKLLHLTTEEGRRRFEREAQVLAELRHPGIAAIHAQGVAEGDRPYLVMEYVDGVPLTRFARDLDERARVELMVRVCDAVAHLHEHGVIHRDLKPGNILVTADGQPKVLDFGLARGAAGDSIQTRAGDVLGTIQYMSPEQALGTPGDADTRSDVYALGVLAYEALSGAPPFDFAGLSLPVIARRLVAEQPPLLPGGGDLAHIVAKALAPEKARRYATAAALADDLSRYLNDESVLARAPSARQQLGRFVRRNKALVAGVVGTVLSLAAGVVAAVAFARDAAREERHARRMAAVASLQAAASAEREGYARNLRRYLDAVPEEERGWEWRYLQARADRSLRVVPLAQPALNARLGSQRALSLGREEPHLRLQDLDTGETLPLAFGAGIRATGGLGLAGDHPFAIGIRDNRFLLVDGGTGDKRDVGACGRGHVLRGFEATPDGSRLGWIVASLGWRLILHVDGMGSFGNTVEQFAFGPDGSRAALGRTGGEIQFVRLPDWGVEAEVRAHDQEVADLAVRADGLVASGSRDQTIALWDPTGAEPIRRLRGHAAPLSAVAFSPDGTRLASGDGAGSVRVWNVATGACERVLLGHAGIVRDLAFRDDERLVSVGSLAVRHWSVGLPDVLRAHRSREDGNPDPYVYGVAYRPDGSQLASAGWDGTVRVYDARTRALLRTLSGAKRYYSVAYSPDGSMIAAGSHDVHLFDARTGERLRRFPAGTGHQIQRVQYTPDGAALLCATKWMVVLLDAGSGEEQGRWPLHGQYHRAAIAPDGRTIAHPRGSVVHLSSSRGAGPSSKLRGHRGEVYDLCFSRDGRLLATAGQDEVVRVWDLARREVVHTLRGHAGTVYAIAFSPDGTRLFSGADDTTVRVWDLKTGDERLELRGHAWYVFDLAVHPDGHTVASASGDNTVRLWTTLTDKELLAGE
ncbi:MAG: WD40 repeat domain-containing serine/threonine protein kinase [Planctomycetota bacterium]|jgi:WD40 repeat protein/predicted Ser/Thr protein kinase